MTSAQVVKMSTTATNEALLGKILTDNMTLKQ